MAPPSRRDDQSGSGDLFAALERGDIAPVYALHGAERYLVDKAHRAIRAAVLGPATGPSFNHDVYDLKESGLDAALASARTMPMFAKRRLVVGRGLDLVKADALEGLVAYAGDPNPSTCLILLPDKADKLDGRLKGIQALKKGGFLHEFPRLRDNDLPRWILRETELRKIPMDADAAAALADATGADLGRLSQAIDQLALFAGQGERVTRTHVEGLIPEGREREIFELMRAIGEGQRDRALMLVGTLLRDREPALLIQGALLRQLRQIWRAKELEAKRTPRGEIAGAIGVPPFFLDQILGPARRMSVAALRRGFERLYQADLQLKSSRIDNELLISRLVRRLVEDAAGSQTR